MPLSWNEIKSRAIAFSKDGSEECSERAEAQSFWNVFFHVFGFGRRRVAAFEQQVAIARAGQKAAAWPHRRLLERHAADPSEHNRPVRLFPFTWAPCGANVQAKTALVDPTLWFGRPVLCGAFVRTETIESRFQAGDSIADMAKGEVHAIERSFEVFPQRVLPSFGHVEQLPGVFDEQVDAVGAEPPGRQRPSFL